MTLHVADQLRALPRRDPVLVSPEATLRDAAHTLWLESVGVAVVGDPDDPRGVISERDVVAAIAQGADPDTMTAADAMTRYVISAQPGDPLFDVAGRMIDDGIRHLPIVDSAGAVTGMVSVRDLLRPLLVDALGGGDRSRTRKEASDE
jgi:CBS domain-containing protein